jgi:outer membrane protein OmpA-like peptidoglycan-associated protein
MKWVSLAFALLGALALGVSGHFWHELLDSPDFKFIFLLSQVQVGGEPADADSAHATGAGFLFLRTLPWFSYAGAALTLAGAGLVMTKGRVAAIPLLVASVLLLLPLGYVVLSVPSLSPYLYAELVGFPSVLAGLAALLVTGKARAPLPHGAEAPVAVQKAGGARKKQLWIGGVAVAALGLIVLLLAGFAGRSKASDDELYFHPSAVALTDTDLFDLGEGPLQAGQMVAAQWDGAWFAARVLSASPDGARIRFVGWESTWDEDLTRARLRSLPDQLVPKMPSKLAPAALGSATATPCAFVLSLYQPEAGLAGVTKLSDLKAKQTLYSPRLDLEDLSLERALAGSPIQAGKPFALAATGTLRVKVPGPYYFAASSNGTTQLWVDDQPVTPDSPIQLDAGVHELRVDHRHNGGSSLTLRLQMGTKPGALRALDLNRDGIAQFAPDEDGSLRLVLDEDLLFDFDRDNLKPSAERALSSIYARSLSPVPRAPVNIEGHTDATGGAQHNLDLSRRRAESVRGWLSAHGRASPIGIQAYGETRPRVPNDSDDHRRLNRRVELVIGPDTAGTPSPEPTAALAAAALPANGTPPNAAPIAPTTPAAPAIATGAPTQAVLEILHAYYRELNDGTFDANRYFEPSVERYITMMNTSTDAMNNYIRNIFPKQFKEHHFELEEGSLSEESPGQYLYVEHSRYIQAGKSQSVEKRVKVRVRLSPAGKLVFLHQFQRL